jgi:hypothetical protein
MDPDTNLAEQLELAQSMIDGEADSDDCERLAELVLALHEWIQRGGAMPEAWDR